MSLSLSFCWSCRVSSSLWSHVSMSMSDVIFWNFLPMKNNWQMYSGFTFPFPSCDLKLVSPKKTQISPRQGLRSTRGWKLQIQISQSQTMAMARHGRAFLASQSSSLLESEPNGTSRLLNVFSSLHTFRQGLVWKTHEGKNFSWCRKSSFGTLWSF